MSVQTMKGHAFNPALTGLSKGLNVLTNFASLNVPYMTANEHNLPTVVVLMLCLFGSHCFATDRTKHFSK